MRAALSVVCFCILIIFSNTFVAHAAESAKVRFEHTRGAIAPTSDVPVQIVLDSGEVVNAFSATIVYPADVLEFLFIDTRDSIVDVWVSRSVSVSGGLITLAGGMKDGFRGERGVVATLVFKARAVGIARLSSADAFVYLADGAGTRISAPDTRSSIEISKNGSLVVFEKNDIDAPVFNDIVRDSGLLDEFPFIAFDVVDRDLGVRDVQARFYRWFTWSEWEPVATPVRFYRSTWLIELRATDNAGNSVRRIILAPGIFMPLFGLILVLVAMIMWTRKRARVA